MRSTQSPEAEPIEPMDTTISYTEWFKLVSSMRDACEPLLELFQNDRSHLGRRQIRSMECLHPAVHDCSVVESRRNDVGELEGMQGVLGCQLNKRGEVTRSAHKIALTVPTTYSLQAVILRYS